MSARDVLIVDWLGRGGIAQTSEAWRQVLTDSGLSTSVATIAGRELVPDHSIGGRGRITRHVRLAAEVTRVIQRDRPRVVVIQNHVIPLLETRVHAAARRVGATIIFVVHDDRLHTLRAGIGVGFRRLAEQADVVVAHSAYVANRLGRPTEVLPLPIALGLLGAPRPERVLEQADLPIALHFGVVKRGYKGVERVVELALVCSDRWRFCIAGVGSRPAPGVVALEGFLEAGHLCRLIEESAVTLLPYRIATQSGAVALSQAMGSVTVASAVGGIPEQIEHGTTGLLIPPDGSIQAWQDALELLSDPAVRSSMADAGRAAVQRRHHEFSAGVIRLCRP